MTMNYDEMQTACVENMRPHFRMVEAICLKEDDFTTEKIQAILLKTLLEALIIDEVTEVGQEFLDKRNETWNEVLSKMEPTILESERLEELQSFHLNPEEIFPVEEPAQSAESNLVIYQNALDSLKDSEGVWIEPIVEEVEEPVVEEPVQADSLLNWSWYLELLSMSENTEGLIALPNVLIKLHNKKLISTKRDLLDTILVSLHGEVGTDGVRQISALFDKLE